MITYILSIDVNLAEKANDILEGWSLMQWINVEIETREAERADRRQTFQ
jgi:hypothetical protein